MSRDGCAWCVPILSWVIATRRRAPRAMRARPSAVMPSGCDNSMRASRISGWTDEHDSKVARRRAGQRQEPRQGMTRRQRRLTIIGGAMAVLALAAVLVLNALRDSIVFFSTPSTVAEKHIPAGRRFRLGGLVQPGSLVRG